MADMSTAQAMSTGKQGVSCTHPIEATCLPRNPVECGILCYTASLRRIGNRDLIRQLLYWFPPAHPTGLYHRTGGGHASLVHPLVAFGTRHICTEAFHTAVSC